MLKLLIENEEVNFSVDILHISPILKTLSEDRTSIDEPIPILNSSKNTFEIFTNWFKTLYEIDFRQDTSELYDDNPLSENFPFKVIYKPDFFKNYDIKTLIELFNFGFYNQIKFFVNTVVYVLSTKNMKLIYNSNKIYIIDFSQQEIINGCVIVNKIYEIFPLLLKLITDYFPDSKFDKLQEELKQLTCREENVIYNLTDCVNNYDLNNSIYVHEDRFNNYCGCKHCLKNGIILPWERKSIICSYRPTFLNLINNHHIKCLILNTGALIFSLKGCSNLRHVILNDDVKEIYDYTFADCTSLESIVIPNIRTIHKYAFKGCVGLESVTISNKLHTIKKSAFKNCINLKRVVCTKNDLTYVNDDIIDLINDKTSSVCILPDVISLDKFAFYKCDFKNLIILSKSGLTKINVSCFESCTSLINVILPKSVKEIHESAFSNCKSLYNIDTFNDTRIVKGLPENLTLIASNAFKNTENLNKDVLIKLSNMELTDYTELPYLRNIENNVLTSLSGINDKDIVIPHGVTKINKIFGNTRINNILLPTSLKELDNHIFHGQILLTSISLPNAITNLPYGTFSFCSSLTSITLPSSLLEISNCCFEYCEKLKEICYIDDIGQKHINELPPLITTIGSEAFSNCIELEYIKIPTSVTQLGSKVFINCKKINNQTF